MQSFPGKIGFPGDNHSDVAAVMSVDDRHLEIKTGDAVIGEWPIAGLQLELGARGYEVMLDGEQLILSPHDRFGFNAAIEQAQEAQSGLTTRRGRKRAAKAEAKAAKAAAKADKAAKVEKPAAAMASTAVETAPLEPSPPAETPVPTAETVVPTKQKRTKVRRPKKARKPKRAPDDQAPKPVPHVEGLEDPDKDALWATHRTQEPGSWRERLNDSFSGVRNLAIVAGVAILALAFFAPAVASLLLVIPGIAAVILAGLSMLDPSMTRLIPGSVTELRLLLIGLALFGGSLLIAIIF